MDPHNDDWPTRTLERLKSALEPPSGRPELLIRRALLGRPAARPRRLFLGAALASAAALAGILALTLPQRFGPAGVERGGEPVARVSISNQGSIVIARRPQSAGGWLVHSGPPAPIESSQIVIVRHGEKP